MKSIQINKLLKNSNPSVLILGFGLEGKATLRFLSTYYPHLKVGIADKLNYSPEDKSLSDLFNSIPISNRYFGDNYLKACHEYNMIIRSPGIKPWEPNIAQALKSGSILTSPSQLFFDHFSGEVIAITGTKGKSTTSSLIFHLLKSAGHHVSLIGNIGKPMLDFLEYNPKIVVVELSSHQLIDLNISPKIAVITNFFKEHQDYYSNINQYWLAKTRITLNQTNSQYLIVNPKSLRLFKLAQNSHAKPLYYSSDQKLKPTVLFDSLSGKITQNNLNLNIDISTIPSIKSVYIDNIAAAITAVSPYKLDSSVIQIALNSFTQLPHRLQYVGNVDNIYFYNDSLATIPESTIKAISALGDKVSTLILGGLDRRQNYSKLVKVILSHKNIKHLILLPATGQIIAKLLQSSKHHLILHHADSMKQVVDIAIKHAQKNSICLLSPAAPSFNLFKDYADRGNQFISNINTHR